MNAKYLLITSLLLIEAISAFAQKNNELNSIDENPLIAYSFKWNDKKYNDLNTTYLCKFLTPKEKEIIWILNMIRFNPNLVAESLLENTDSKYYVKQSSRNHYYTSLLNTLKKLKPNTNPLQPDSLAFISAKCHAITSGKTGYVGHDRKRNECKKDFFGECCDYGNKDPLDILMSLLLDYDVPSLGHRDICLSADYSLIGTSIQPHKIYEYNAVLDFK